MPHAKLNDISIYYEVHGAGTPLILVGGLGSDSASWLGVIKELSLHFQTIIFDNRGCGRTELGHAGCTISIMAEDVIHLLDFLRVERTHVIGHSMGGYIAQELAIHYPGRIGKLILESTAPVSSRRNNLLFDEIYNQLKREGHSEAWIKRWVFWLFSQKFFTNNLSFIDTFIKGSLQYPYLQKPDGFKSQLEAIALFDVRSMIDTIQADTLIIEGKDDILITPEETEVLARGIQGSAYQLLDNVAHCIHIENSKLFIDTVLAFLNAKK